MGDRRAQCGVILPDVFANAERGEDENVGLLRQAEMGARRGPIARPKNVEIDSVWNDSASDHRRLDDRSFNLVHQPM